MIFPLPIKCFKTVAMPATKPYFAGGCVRDMLLGLKPHDYDIATDALPEEIEKLFSRTIPVGAQFGVIIVLEEQFEIQVATFRNDGSYRDGRHPNNVTFTNAEEDASGATSPSMGFFTILLQKKFLIMLMDVMIFPKKLFVLLAIPTSVSLR